MPLEVGKDLKEDDNPEPVLEEEVVKKEIEQEPTDMTNEEETLPAEPPTTIDNEDLIQLEDLKGELDLVSEVFDSKIPYRFVLLLFHVQNSLFLLKPAFGNEQVSGVKVRIDYARQTRIHTARAAAALFFRFYLYLLSYFIIRFSTRR